MRLFEINLSRQLSLGILSMHLIALISIWDKLIFLPLVLFSFWYSFYKWVCLQSKTSINAIKIQNTNWQIKICGQWYLVKLNKVMFFGWVFLQFYNKTNNKIQVALIAPDSLKKSDWRELSIATKINVDKKIKVKIT